MMASLCSAWASGHSFSLPEFGARWPCRFGWRANSIAFWDNRSCQHYAVADYAPAMRAMERVTIMGDKPFYNPDQQ